MRKIETPIRPTEVGINTDAVEKLKSAKYIGDFCIKNSLSGWANQPFQIYYQEVPPVEGYSNYFAVFLNMGQPMITSAKSIEGLEFDAIEHNGKIYYSAYRHDYRGDPSSSVAIDGGRDYTRIIGEPKKTLRLKIIGPDIFEI